MTNEVLDSLLDKIEVNVPTLAVLDSLLDKIETVVADHHGYAYVTGYYSAVIARLAATLPSEAQQRLIEDLADFAAVAMN